MREELSKMTEKWMQLERKTLKQRQAADEFYEKKLMKPIETAFLENNTAKCTESVDYLIVSVGTSYEPIVLSICLFRPEKILFLYTEQTEKVLDKIVSYCNLGASSYEKERVHETSPLDIYIQIKRAYLRWNQPEKIYIDFTGGTKSMSAAAAMAGAMINIQLVYVGTNEYMVDFRKPRPGSETLYFIQNPVEVFGDLEAGKAMALFGEYNYAGAVEKIQKLKEQVPDPNMRQQLTFAWLLAKTYEHWDALEFEKAEETICILNRQLHRDQYMHKNFLLMDFYGALQEQEKMLKQLARIPGMLKERKQMEILKDSSLMTPLMFTMYNSALVRAQQEKYDMATLLLYRLLEMMEQKRLAGYQLYASAMEYHKMVLPKEQVPEAAELAPDEKLDWLKQTVNQEKKELFGRAGNGYLPDQISLLEGFLILMAFRDPFIYKKDERNMDVLKRIRAMVYLRNNSIFAHGLGPVPVGDYMKFYQFVEDLFKQFCQTEGISFEQESERIKWLNPTDSVNYSGIGV